METKTEYLFPVAVSETGGNVEGAERLLAKKPLQIGLNESAVTVLSGKSYVLLDFGREVCGSVRILTHLAAGPAGSVRIRLGESWGEASAPLVGETPDATATNDHSLRDARVTLPNYSDMRFFNSGFRFARIELVSEQAEARLKCVVAEAVTRDIVRRGSFECSDARVNAIYETAAYTLLLNMQNGMLWDGIKRDRLVWIGDIHPEMRAIQALYGGDPCVADSLSFTTDQVPLPGWMNGIPMYSMWWIVILYDHYLQSGDLAYLRGQRAYLTGLVGQISACVDERGETGFDTYLLDWPTHETEDERAGVTALAVLAMERASYLLAVLGEDTAVSSACLARLRRTRRRAARFKQAAALEYLAGLRTDSAMLTAGGAQGLSTFMSYYILSAVSKACGAAPAVAMLRDYYGGMLDLGATTFWEDFDVDWLKNAARIDERPAPGKIDVHAAYGKYCYKGYRHSLCHGWSSGVVPYLAEHVLGVSVLEPGCRRVAVRPDLGGLRYASGVYPTPLGDVRVEAESREEGVRCTVLAPKGITVER